MPRQRDGQKRGRWEIHFRSLRPGSLSLPRRRRVSRTRRLNASRCLPPRCAGGSCAGRTPDHRGATREAARVAGARRRPGSDRSWRPVPGFAHRGQMLITAGAFTGPLGSTGAIDTAAASPGPVRKDQDLTPGRKVRHSDARCGTRAADGGPCLAEAQARTVWDVHPKNRDLTLTRNVWHLAHRSAGPRSLARSPKDRDLTLTRNVWHLGAKIEI